MTNMMERKERDKLLPPNKNKVSVKEIENFVRGMAQSVADFEVTDDTKWADIRLANDVERGICTLAIEAFDALGVNKVFVPPLLNTKTIGATIELGVKIFKAEGKLVE